MILTSKFVGFCFNIKRCNKKKNMTRLKVLKINICFIYHAIFKMVTSKEVKMSIHDLVGVCMQEAGAPKRVTVNDVTYVTRKLRGESAVQNVYMGWL